MSSSGAHTPKVASTNCQATGIKYNVATLLWFNMHCQYIGIFLSLLIYISMNSGHRWRRPDPGAVNSIIIDLRDGLLLLILDPIKLG